MTRTVSVKNHVHPYRHRLITSAAGLLLAIASSGCTAPGPRNDLMTKRKEGEGENKKKWSGLSFADQTHVAPVPTPSPMYGGFDEERVWSGADDWEPVVAADPSSSFVYQLTTRFGAFPTTIVFRRSSDGGATWEPDKPLVDSGLDQGDPQIQVADDGTVYAAFIDWDWSTVLVKSFDHGDTWTPQVDATASLPWTDHPWLTISPDGCDVYFGLNVSDSFVIASHDCGETFEEPILTSQDNRYWYHTGGAVAPNGDVYFAAVDYSQSYQGDAHISVIRSIDGGLNWETTLLDTSSEAPPCNWAPGCYFGFLGPTAGLGIDAEGSIAVAYNAGLEPNAPNQIWVTISDDGENWSTPEPISHDSPDANNVFPAVVGGPAPGDFRVIWQGDANGNTSGWNTWYRRTTDGGENWGSLVRLSDLGDGAPYKNEEGYQFPYGDYLGLAIDGEGTNHAIWGEGASWNGPGGTWYTRGLGPCEGDANGDGNIDPLDSGYVLARFGCPVGTGDPACDSADQNGDGAVDPLDSGFVLARFGECL